MNLDTSELIYSLRLKLDVSFEFYTVVKEMINNVVFDDKMYLIYQNILINYN